MNTMKIKIFILFFLSISINLIALDHTPKDRSDQSLLLALATDSTLSFIFDSAITTQSTPPQDVGLRDNKDDSFFSTKATITSLHTKNSATKIDRKRKRAREAAFKFRTRRQAFCDIMKSYLKKLPIEEQNRLESAIKAREEEILERSYRKDPASDRL